MLHTEVGSDGIAARAFRACACFLGTHWRGAARAAMSQAVLRRRTTSPAGHRARIERRAYLLRSGRNCYAGSESEEGERKTHANFQMIRESR